MPIPSDSTGGTGSNLCSSSPSDLQGQIDNLVTRIERIEIILSQLLGMDITAILLSDISSSIGDVIAAAEGIFGTSVGYAPYALQTGYDTRESTIIGDSDSVSLLGLGRTALFPFQMSAKMKFAGVGFRGNGIGNTKWELHIYKEDTTGRLTKVASCEPGDDFFPSPDERINPATPYPKILNPGSYFLALQNASSSILEPITIYGKSTGVFLLGTGNRFFINAVRVGVAALGAQTIVPAAWSRRFLYGHFVIYGILDGEAKPYPMTGEFDY